METLAVLESNPQRLASVVETAALRDGSGEGTREIFIRVTEEAVETPASNRDASLGSYCTLAAERLDRLEVTAAPHADAMFEIDPFLGWLDWFDADRVTIRLVGEVGIASQLVLSAGDDEVRMACIDDRALLEGVDTVLPERFDGGRFLDSSGNPMPTAVETTTEQLDRVVAAVGLSESVEGYPVVVRDGSLAVDVTGETAHASAPLDSPAEGPAVTNHYGREFAAVVDGLDGEVCLQTGPGEPVAFVREGDGFTLRFVVAPI